MAIPLAPGERAHMYALGGVMRGGVGRGGYVDGRVYISYDGEQVGFARDDQGIGVIIESLAVDDVLDETPNTCRFRVHGAVPARGVEVVITLGSKNRRERVFGGYALTVNQRYAARRPIWVQGDVSAVDYTWLLGFTKVTAKYLNQSASAIVRDLVARFAGANGFTTVGVVDGLAILDEITFTNEDLPAAITRTVRRAGAYWYVDYLKDVHAFVTESRNGDPRPLVPTHKTFAAFTRTGDGTQVLTRVYVEGRGSRLLASVNVGDDRVPVDSVDMFAPDPDVFLKASFQGSDGGAQHLNFTGVDVGGAGSLVGPGNAPAAPPTLTLQAGGAVDIGPHGYAYSWVTAAGETKPSAIAVVATGAIPTPTIAPRVSYIDDPVQPPPMFACWGIGDWVEFAYSYGPSNSLAAQSPLSPLTGIVAIQATHHWSGTTPGSNAQGFYVSLDPSPDPNVKNLVIWHRINGGPWFAWLMPTIGNGGQNPWPQAYLSHPQSQCQQWAPASSSQTLQTVRVAGIAVGPASVTGRKLYRTKANASTLQLVTTIANNAATEYVDAAADATLGATPPPGDTSGLQQPVGQIAPGASSIIVASTGPFRPDGGWAILGNGDQVVRYSGISGGSIVGLPPTGRGALTATVVYNTTITAAPLLLGIPPTGSRSIVRPLTDGDEIYLVVQVDDQAAQAALADVLHVPNAAREDWIQDRRLSITEARARGQATLRLRPLEETAVHYTCRDLLTASGKTIHVDLPAPTNVVGDFKIQQVTIGNFRPHANQYPTFTVMASSSRFSFDDWLNRIETKE